MTIDSCASSISKYPHVLCNSVISCNPACKYLGVNFECKLCPNTYRISDGETRKTNWFDKTSSLFQRTIWLKFCNSNISSIFEYDILIYGCSSKSHLNPPPFFQRKIQKLIHFRCKRDDYEDIFTSNENLTVFGWHPYELLNFLLGSVTENHAQKFLNDLFRYENSLRSTRRSAQNLKVPWQIK